MSKLGVNIDHVATLRQQRKEGVPSLVHAALEAVRGGANGITVHLREDRRHIQDADVPALLRALSSNRGQAPIALNLEMALAPEIIKIALRLRPAKVCLVPERRAELTTEGGLDLAAKEKILKKVLPKFRQRKIQVSLFIDPDRAQILTAARVGAQAIEIHTGTYAHARGARQTRELVRIRGAAKLARSLGLAVHAGHGIDYKNIKPLCRIPEISEFNIGFSIVSRAIFVGMRRAVGEMKQALKN